MSKNKQKSNSELHCFFRFLKYAQLKKYFLLAVAILILSVGSQQVIYITASLSAKVMNILQESILQKNENANNFYKIIFFTSMIFGIEIISWIAMTISSFLQTYWKDRIGRNLKNIFLKKDFVADVTDHESPEYKDIRSLCQKENPVNYCVSIFLFLGQCFQIFLFSYTLWNINPWMIPIAVFCKVPLLWVNLKIKRDQFLYEKKTETARRELNYYYNLPIQRDIAKEYRIYELEGYAKDKYERGREEYLKVFKTKYVSEKIGHGIKEHYDTLVLVFVQLFLGFFVFEKTMSFGDFTLYVAAFTNLSSGTKSILLHLTAFKDMGARSKMICDHIDKSTIFSRAEKEKKCISSNERHIIEFVNVCFSYPNSSKKILNDFCMVFETGKSYAVVGLNGSGKTTLISLLLRLYEPSSGEILLDGIPISDYNIYEYYNLFSCVFQHTSKQSLSVREYISQTSDGNTEDVLNALKKADILECISEFPSGIDTALTNTFSAENVFEPSLGQWQKLSIARALFKNAPVMVLDEPSASLDVLAESEIFDYVNTLKEEKIILLVSHRLSNIINCDSICLLDDGTLIEKGSHAYLIKLNKHYAKLFKDQAKYYKC